MEKQLARHTYVCIPLFHLTSIFRELFVIRSSQRLVVIRFFCLYPTNVLRVSLCDQFSYPSTPIVLSKTIRPDGAPADGACYHRTKSFQRGSYDRDDPPQIHLPPARAGGFCLRAYTQERPHRRRG